MIIEITLLVLGFAALLKGADFLVEGSSALAKRLGISDLIIGLTVVSFGTSAPEVVVNLIAAVRGTTDLALGNIIGSNIANTLLILGAAAAIYPLRIKSSTVWKEIPLVILASVSVFLLVNDNLFEGGTSAVTRVDGFMLLLLFAIFMYYIFGQTRQQRADTTIHPDIHRLTATRATAYVALGLLGLALGGHWIINGAIAVSSALGISQSVIGLTVLAIGTSLPELATSAIAAWKKNTDIAVGNIVGSNIFNLLFVLALTSIIRPLPLAAELNIDIGVATFSAVLLFATVFMGRTKRTLERWEGILFLVLYAAYMIYLGFRG